MEKLDLDKFVQTAGFEFNDPSEIDEFSDRYIWPRNKIINNEHQWYVDREDGVFPDPVSFDNSKLTIVAKAVRTAGMPYSSGVITSRNAQDPLGKGFHQKYGYWEMSAKLPNAKGAWPAFWLLPTRKTWPEGIAILHEIDIMEAINKPNGVYHGSIHSNQTGKLESDGRKFDTGLDLVNEFHRYGCLWEEDYITMYFNGEPWTRFVTPDDMKTDPCHFLLNLAVGGNWPGNPDPKDYPAEYVVDYVRVYQRGEEPVDRGEPVTTPPVDRGEPVTTQPPVTTPPVTTQPVIDAAPAMMLSSGKTLSYSDLGEIIAKLAKL